MKSENGKTWLLFLLIVAVVGTTLFFTLKKPREKSIAEWSKEFKANIKVIEENNETLALIEEYETLSKEIENTKDAVKGK